MTTFAAGSCKTPRILLNFFISALNGDSEAGHFSFLGSKRRLAFLADLSESNFSKFFQNF